MPDSTDDSEELFEEFFFDFDQPDLKRFVQKLPQIIPKGFGKPQVAEVLRSAEKLTPRRKSMLEFPIEFEDADTKVVVVLYSEEEEPETLTLYLYGRPSLIASVESELSRFVEEIPED